MSAEGLGALQTAVATTFIGAAAAKAMSSRDLSPFLVVLGVGRRVAPMLGRSLVVVEAIVGIWLLTPWTARAAALCALSLGVAFAGAQLWAISRRASEPCACFGALDSAESTPVPLVRSLLLVGIASALAVATLNGQTVVNITAAPVLGVFLGAAMAAGAIVSLAVIEQVYMFLNVRKAIAGA